MTIDPRFGLYLSIALAVLSYLAGAGGLLTTLFGEHTTTAVLAIFALVSGIGNTINAVLHAIPSKPNTPNEFPLGPKA